MQRPLLPADAPGARVVMGRRRHVPSQGPFSGPSCAITGGEVDAAMVTALTSSADARCGAGPRLGVDRPEEPVGGQPCLGRTRPADAEVTEKPPPGPVLAAPVTTSVRYRTCQDEASPT